MSMAVVDQMMTQTAFSRRLKELRAKAGISQEKLARMADVSLKQMSRYELGHQLPTFDKLQAIARALGVGLGDFDVPPDYEPEVIPDEPAPEPEKPARRKGGK